MFASLSPRARALVPSAALAVLLAVLLLGSHSRPPVIEAADPRIGHGGDVLIVTGRGFGAERDGGQVLIAGVAPTSSAYLEWSGERISVRVPAEVRSGFVYVVAGGRRSNGVLFANRDHLPRVGSALADPGQPLVVSLDKPRATVGEPLVITGRNFGPQRGSAAVLFTWLSADLLSSGVGTAEFVAADAHDLDYESWPISRRVERNPPKREVSHDNPVPVCESDDSSTSTPEHHGAPLRQLIERLGVARAIDAGVLVRGTGSRIIS